MLQLIKLEIKKYKLNKYIKGVIISIIGIMAFLTMSFIDTKINTPNDLDKYKSVIWMINVLSTDVALIFASTITGKIAIGEYRNKTILVMFSYPINRKKLMLSKLIIVFVFSMVCVFISDLICILYAVGLDSIFNVIGGSFNFNYLIDSSLSILGFTVMAGILSLAPFAIGMKKKSVPSAVVTAVIIAALMQPVIGHDPQVRETLIKLVIITLITFALTTYTLVKDINNIDYANIA